MLPIAILQTMLVATSAVTAFRFGGSYERLGAIILLANLGCAWLAIEFDRPSFGMVEQAGDLLSLAAFLFLAMRSDRFWLLWAAGIQLAAIIQQHLNEPREIIRSVSICTLSLLLLVITVHRSARTR